MYGNIKEERVLKEAGLI